MALHLVALSMAVLLALMAVAAIWAVDGRRARPVAAMQLRVEHDQWWWQKRPGEEIAVVPAILADLEDWMLLRWTHAARPWRPGAHGFLAVRRADLGAAWPLFRVHLHLSRHSGNAGMM